jgi:signal transduction histidine kinase
VTGRRGWNHQTVTATASRTVQRRVPALRREGRLVAGVAAGLADALGVAPIVLRTAFVALAVAGALGVLLYAVAWVVMAAAGGKPVTPPDVDGLGPSDRVLGLGLVVVGVALLVQTLDLGFPPSVAWPMALVGLGLLVAWHRGRLGAFVEGRDTLLRVGLGVGLAGAGVVGLLALNLDVTAARDTIVLSLAVAAGLALVAAPSIAGLARDLAHERRERIRSEERDRVAAHLHDSVLQTLALIQQRAEDPGATRALARRQERELRTWLYGSPADPAGRLRGRLERLCAGVEELHGVPVELVVVGDAPVDERVSELLAATREALVNAAKHSGAVRLDVFAEVADGSLDVFVRDTGRGFDPAVVGEDRRGLRDSVIARVARVGGRVTVTSSPGQGAEVELRLPLVPA